MSTAFRAPLAERSAVNRQVLGSIPSGGASFLLLFFFRSHAVGQTTAWAVHRTDAMAQWQRVGFQIRRLGVRIPLASCSLLFLFCAAEHLPARVYRPWDQKLDAMAQWQRVGFQILRLGVRVPLASGTSVTFGSSFMLPAGPVTRCRSSVPVAQLDKASDYESEDWGFKSLQGYLLLFAFNQSVETCFARDGALVPCLDARVV